MRQIKIEWGVLLLTAIFALAYLAVPSIKLGTDVALDRLYAFVSQEDSAVVEFTPKPRAPKPVAKAVPIVVAPVTTVEKKPETYTVREHDVLSRVFPTNWQAVCTLNKIANCNRISEGDVITLPVGVVVIARKAVQRLADGTLPIARLGVDPYRAHRTVEKDRKILSAQGYTLVEIDEYLSLRAEGKCVREEFSRGTKFPWMSFGDARVLTNLSASWQKSEPGLICKLQSGRNVIIMEECENLTEGAREEAKVSMPEEPALSPEKDEPLQQDDDAVDPVFVTQEEVAGKPRCEVQAGAGAYANRVYAGKWVYGETICYIWKDGEWQAGPGFYGMLGSGQSTLSAFHNKERGIGGQIGLQRNWINDRNHFATLDLKLRFLWDRSWGENPDSGYSFTQNGKKLGLFVGYTEKLNNDGDLAGIIGEYWKSFGQTVDSTWKAQPVQNRGSVSLSGFYETNLSDDGAWRQRIIGGWQYTNWDQQNWARGIYEVRYDGWLMFGPQIALPLGISNLNQPLTARDLTTIGAFVRVELGGKAVEAYADSSEGQLEFIPAPTGEAETQPTQQAGEQLEFVPITAEADEPTG